MAGSQRFKETILKLLSYTDYSLDNLKEHDISSFENITHLKSFFEWFSQNISEKNCVTYADLEEYKKIQEKDDVIYGEQLEEALYGQNKDILVPFKESLTLYEQELGLLKDQLHYKQLLYATQSTQDLSLYNELSGLKIELKIAKGKQAEVIKEITCETKKFNEKIIELSEIVNELQEDIIGLVQNEERSEVLITNEGISTFTPENTNVSTCSVYTESSQQWFPGKGPEEKDSSTPYLCQQSFLRYEKIHHTFLSILIKSLKELEDGKYHRSEIDINELFIMKERLETQMNCHVRSCGELESLKTQREKIKEFQEEQDLKLKLRKEFEEMKLSALIGSSSQDEEKLYSMIISVCQKWSEFKTLEGVYSGLKQRIESSEKFLRKVNQFSNALTSKLQVNKIIDEFFVRDYERIELSIKMCKSFHELINKMLNEMIKSIEIMDTNSKDYEDFCFRTIEERSELVEHLASIMGTDEKNVVKTMMSLSDKSQKIHSKLYEEYNKEIANIISRGKDMEDLLSSNLQSCNNTESEMINDLYMNVQKVLDHMDELIQEANCTISSQEEADMECDVEVLDKLKKLLHQEQ